MEESDLQIDKLFDEAIKLRDGNDLPKAIDKFNEALELAVDTNKRYRAGILRVVGHLYYLQKDFDNARECLQEAVELSPDSELGSLGLFHTLWDMGDEWAAFREAKRFLSRHDSKKYFLMIEEMRDAFLDAGIDVKPSSSWRTGH